MYPNNANNTYKNNSIMYASKEQLLLMLLDGSIKFSKLARQAILDKDIKKSHENLLKTQNIYFELISSLDLSTAGSWGTDLVRIYQFIIEKLKMANVKKDIEILDEVMPLIQDIRNIWEEAYKLSKSSSVG